jgi:tetratricopeptide (TPR) repeat protein
LYDQVFGCKEMYHQDGLIRGVRQSLQIAAEICFQAAEYAPSRQIWAALKNSEAISLSILGERGDAAALARSVTAYEAALAVYTRDAAPMDWAMTQNNLANALLTLGQRGDEAALSRSVTAYEAALEVRTREATPMDWAMTRGNMGLLYLFRAERGELDYLDLAISAFEDALSVYSEEHHPYDFGTASSVLQKALALRDGSPPDA